MAEVVTGVTGAVSPEEENVQPITDSMQATPPEGELILGKFKTTEDLANAYKELEKKLGTTKEETPSTEENKPTVDTAKADDKVQEVLQVAGLKLDDLQKEYDEGGLSEESYKKLADAGIPRAIVDSYIQGQEALLQKGQALADETIQELLSVAGGQEEYALMVKWASENMSAEEIEAYNMAIASGNKHLAAMAVKGLVTSYQREYGSDPKLLGGTSSYLDSTDKFNSIDEMVSAMSDPRYKTDTHYRKQVEAKVVRSRLMRAAR